MHRSSGLTIYLFFANLQCDFGACCSRHQFVLHISIIHTKHLRSCCCATVRASIGLIEIQRREINNYYKELSHFFWRSIPPKTHCSGTGRACAFPGFRFTTTDSSIATMWPGPPICCGLLIKSAEITY